MIWSSKLNILVINLYYFTSLMFWTSAVCDFVVYYECFLENNAVDHVFTVLQTGTQFCSLCHLFSKWGSLF